MSAISMESLTFKDFVLKGQFEVYKSTLPADHLARAAVEIMLRIRDAGMDHDRWLQDLKVASGWEEDPLKLVHAIASYESCCRCTIESKQGSSRRKRRRSWRSASRSGHASSRFWSHSGPLLRSSAPVPKSQGGNGGGTAGSQAPPGHPRVC